MHVSLSACTWAMTGIHAVFILFSLRFFISKPSESAQLQSLRAKMFQFGKKFKMIKFNSDFSDKIRGVMRQPIELWVKKKLCLFVGNKVTDISSLPVSIGANIYFDCCETFLSIERLVQSERVRTREKREPHCTKIKYINAVSIKAIGIDMSWMKKKSHRYRYKYTY